MSHQDNRVSRRVFAGSALAVAGLAATRTAASGLRETAWGPMGPFYPVDRFAEEDADLTWLKGHSKRALGNVIEVTGRVLDKNGNPIDGARLELWQCNAAGRYAHSADIATAPLDPDFQGYASIKTGAKGEWKITTIKPAAYDSPIGRRTPHIHFDIMGKQHRLISQMYFADDHAMNSTDTLYKMLGEDAITSVARLDAPSKYHWDVVLIS